MLLMILYLHKMNAYEVYLDKVAIALILSL